MKNTKSVWDDISFVWKRIAAVIAAVGVLSAFLINTFSFHSGKTILIASTAGFVVLLTSFYVDKQTKYIEENFNTVMNNHEVDANKHIQIISKTVDDLKSISLDTRKDTLRIQLMLLIQNQPENIDSILKLAETYFMKLHGDWYMTSEFKKWAKMHDIEVPDTMFQHVDKEQ